MVGRTYSTTLVGIDANLVQVEAQITGALKRFTMVGLPDGVVRESRERVRCAIEQSGYSFPTGDVVISLSPANLPKYGSGFDLAIAVSILAASGTIDPEAGSKVIYLGELALDGSLRPTHGSLGAACLAREQTGFSLVVPHENGGEAGLVPGVDVRVAGTLEEVVSALLTRGDLPSAVPAVGFDDAPTTNGFGDVVGQFAAKRALEIAAAGGHSMLLVGVPGAGKSMLASRITSLLPPLTQSEQIEVTKVYSAVKAWDRPSESGKRLSLIRNRPFRAPHHSMSTAGLLGGGPMPIPGEISLAHRGVLFLDEITEVRREALESLRQPLETKSITVSRAKMRVTFPSDFIFLAAMNPCPCGKRGLPDGGCLCTPPMIARYMGKISGPILDRIDLHLWVPPVPITAMAAGCSEDPTESMRRRVLAARHRQEERGMLNTTLGQKEVRRYCEITGAGAQLLERAAQRFRLSARGYTRILRTARTIADLEGETDIHPSHIAEVLQYRFQSE